MEQEKKYCLCCNEWLMTGRIDRKFCGDACRNGYHNDEFRNRNNLMRNIVNSLKRNRRALIVLAEKQTATIAELAALGFVQDYFTHVSKCEEDTVFYCFDMGYKFVEGLSVHIVSASPSGVKAV